MSMVKDRDKTDTARRWGFVFAIARPWKTVEEKSLKHLVTHVPHKYDQCTRVPREGRKGRQTFWTYSTCLCLRHVGDVTVVLSKKGRNLGPQHTKILVTNLAELTPSQVVCISAIPGGVCNPVFIEIASLSFRKHLCHNALSSQPSAHFTSESGECNGPECSQSA